MTKINNTIEVSVEESIPTHHQEAFYLSAEFWVGIAFVLVVLTIYKPAYKAIKNMLGNRINNIKEKLQEAENLKLDAQSLYAKYERKLHDIENEINKIITEENILIEENKEEKIKDLNSKLRQKEKEVDAKVEIMYEKASQEINTLLIDKSIETIYKLIKTKLTKANYTKMIEKSISNISKTDFN
ncbi:MAG: ATP synthase F0 subunit B [Alphaproteobacteria bacterium]|jgi:F-type H+-transporting ATPase subunit b|nr:ATP synthase F0 subunit B [Alphaproteobacteria bacterium]